MSALRRKSHERHVSPDLRLDRIALASRFAQCLRAERTNHYALAQATGIPVKQLQHIAARKRVMDWAYHACAMWCAQVEGRALAAERREARAAARERRLMPGVDAERRHG